MPRTRSGKAMKKNKKRSNATGQKSKNRGSKGQTKGALVIGGGISGIQTALDLAEAGIFTYLIEKSPSIGGRMAQLDKTFPTNDCAMCILSPKLVSVARHPNIRLLTNSEVSSVTGKPGNFTVEVIKHPRYVDEDKCVGCGECATKCPVKLSNEFDLGLGMRKAIYVPFPQAVPLVYTIDPVHCKYIQNGKCGVCAKICKADAINYEQTDEKITLEIGAVIVSTGYEQFDPSDLKELGYSKYENVITGLEFERLLNAAGPTMGKILRRSDEKPPKKILFVQCVGSRDIHRASEYCSRICCMYAIKEAMIAREHQPDLDEITVLNMGIRAYGKGFEEYYKRAQAEGVAFIQGRPAMINEDSKTGELLVKVEDVEAGEIREIQTDLVVLSSAVIPGKTNKQLSKLLNIELDEHGFFKENSLIGSASQSTRDGIYLAGCAQGPKDIPDSVAQGSAAAALAEKYLFGSRVTFSNHDKQTSEMTTAKADITLVEPRIGVFVCHCGINIGGILDVPDLVKYAKKLPNVVFATDNLYTCSDDAQAKIQDLIKEHDLTRVVVAACTPRTHEPIFKDTCSKAGLNAYLFDMTNIRDQCSWVHMREPEKGTVKAKDLIRMAVARAAQLQPLETISTPIDQSALVIGGGISGMQCALDLAAQQIQTTLIEMSTKLGGRLNQLNMLAPIERPPGKLIKEIHEQLKKAGVKIYTGYKPVDIQGYVGNFEVTIEPTENKNKSRSKQLKLDTGAIVLAIGAGLYEPENGVEFGYGKYKNVITNLELESRLKDKSLSKSTKNIVFIQCVGARESHKKDGNQGCSRYCCQTTLHQAVQLAEQGVQVTILHKGIRAFSKYAEELYYKAGQLGIRFVQFPEDMAPKVHNKGSKICVHDLSLARQLDIPADLIVLSLAMRPNQNEAEQLQKWLKIPRSQDGFFMELHPKLAPVETNTVGIYLCGCAQAPKDVTDSLAQASAAAAKVAALVSNKELVVEPITAAVNERICWGCGTCEEGCEFGAVEVVVKELREGIKSKIAQVNAALCKGCGICASRCPSGAMSIRHFTNNQITSQVKAFGEVTG